jgi:WD40 repeat protein
MPETTIQGQNMFRLNRHSVIATIFIVTVISAIITYNVSTNAHSSHLITTIEVQQPVSHVLMSPDQKRIIAAAEETQRLPPSLLIWDMQDQKVTARIPQEQGISGMSVSADSKTLAVIDKEDVLTVYDLGNAEAITQKVTLQACNTRVYNNYYVSRIAFNPHTSEVAIICRDGSIAIYNYITKNMQEIAPKTQAQGLAYSKEEPVLGLLELSNYVTLWDTVTQMNVETIPLHEPSLVGRIVVFCPNETVIATQSTGSLQEWTTNNQRLLAEEAFEIYTDIKAINQDCSQIATISFETLPNSSLIKNNNIQITFRGNSQRQPIILQGHRNKVRSIAFGYDGFSVVSGSEDGIIHLWNIE